MKVQLLATDSELNLYDKWIKSHPHGSLWQSLERKKYVEALGKEVRIYVAIDANKIVGSAMVVIDETAFNIRTWDIPRGPIVKMENGKLIIDNLLKMIIGEAKKEKSLTLFFSPPFSIINSQLSILSRPSNRHIHCEATRIIDLTKTEEEILAQMKPKGRYNIKVAKKSGVTVKESNDIDAFYKLVSETGGRDGFTSLPKSKYKTFLDKLDGSFLLLAYEPENKEPIAGVLSVIWPPYAPEIATEPNNASESDSEAYNGASGGKNKRGLPTVAPRSGAKVGIYYYGASSYAHRALMAPYVLQMESIRLCKNKGCQTYDLLGIAPTNSDDTHPWFGISKFKEKFGGIVVTYPPEQRILLRPMMNWMLNMKRRLWK